MKQAMFFLKRSSKQWLCLVGQSLQQDQDTKQSPRDVKEDHPQKIEPEDKNIVTRLWGSFSCFGSNFLSSGVCRLSQDRPSWKEMPGPTQPSDTGGIVIT